MEPLDRRIPRWSWWIAATTTKWRSADGGGESAYPELFGLRPHGWTRSPAPGGLLAGKPRVAMFCTGGIRCEKSTALMRMKGFDEVYHLEGGILKYLETVPEAASSWQGECFVFDERGVGGPCAGAGRLRAVPRLRPSGERGRARERALRARSELPALPPRHLRGAPCRASPATTPAGACGGPRSRAPTRERCRGAHACIRSAAAVCDAGAAGDRRERRAGHASRSGAQGQARCCARLRPRPRCRCWFLPMAR